MLTLRRVSHRASECREALAGAVGPIYIDTETTGLEWIDRIVSVGVLIEDIAFILFVRSDHLSINKHSITIAQLQEALQPLATRHDLTTVFHTAIFDVSMLQRDGIDVRCKIEDTQKLLKLIDSDRGWESDDKSKTGSSTGTIARWERHYRARLNYRLKDCVLHLLDIDAPHFPGAAARLPYKQHVNYLASDLLITRELHRYVTGLLTPTDRQYYDWLVSPITPLLVAMRHTGCLADAEFVHAESRRLKKLMRRISRRHEEQFGPALDSGDPALRQWVFGRLGCRVLRRIKVKGEWVPSLKQEVLRELHRREDDDTEIRRSLGLLLDYLLARWLYRHLKSLAKYVDRQTGRFHSVIDDRQLSGRISSSKPNLLGIATQVVEGGRKEFVSEEFKQIQVKSRNAIVASPGYRLVAFDIAQSDVRGLAHLVESFPYGEIEFLEMLQDERHFSMEALGQWDHFRPEKVKPKSERTHFDPKRRCLLAADFRRRGRDFYTVAATRMRGKPPKDKTERNDMKQTILGIVNGMSAQGLARRLDISKDQAAEYLRDFADAYPQVAAFTEMMYRSFAITGKATTFAGRTRRITGHWWMANERELELFVSYKDADKLRVLVVPLRPERHGMTCYVKSVVDVGYDSIRKGQEIYHHIDGRISRAPYRFFDDDEMVFSLPYRNISWRLIRKVRTAREEVRYQGFDKTCRQLFNHLCQGATAEIAKQMMLRSVTICRTFAARLLLQIHDELVFEVPVNNVGRFIRSMQRRLQRPPTPEFRIPIVVEPKTGRTFGELKDVPSRLSALPSPNLGRIVRQQLARRRFRHLRRLIHSHLAGRPIAGRRQWNPEVGNRHSRSLIRRILGTYK